MISSTSGPISARRSWPIRPIRRYEFNESLSKLASFILPGGTPGAALLHQARTVARRAERSAWMLYEADPEHTNREAMLYLNRLSDLLFILSRVANPSGDVLWRPGGE
jgi:cob(I)alamin adenosyltransferase